MKEFRCKFCHRLLAKIGEAKLLEIKCPKCKTLNTWRDDVVYIVEVDEKAVDKKYDNGRVKYELVEN
jgi:phage FluMu protein Com